MRTGDERVGELGVATSDWGIDSEFFQYGVKLDPTACGAGWARIAVAARASSPQDAAECARRALASNPVAWRRWYEAFAGSLKSPREVAPGGRAPAGWRSSVLRGQ
jgi:hypothetical protein